MVVALMSWLAGYETPLGPAAGDLEPAAVVTAARREGRECVGRRVVLGREVGLEVVGGRYPRLDPDD